MRLSLFPLFLLLLPFAEIAGFILVGQAIGLWPTLGLVITTSVLGAVLLRVQGTDMLRQMASESQSGRTPGRQLVHAAMIVIAAFLLILPGFLTDIIGVLFFIPFVRDFIWKHMSSRIVVMGSSARFSTGPMPGRGKPPTRGPVVDLDGDDFRRDGDPKSPWSGNPRIDKGD